MLDYRAIYALPILLRCQSGREPLLQLLRFAARPELRAYRDGDDALVSSTSSSNTAARTGRRRQPQTIFGIA
jgi:hypothetical protein